MLKRDGPVRLVAGAARRYLVDQRHFYLYEHRHREWPEAAFCPLADEFEERFVSDNREADSIAVEHEDFRLLLPRSRHALDCGAMAFCVYSGIEVAHVAWLATSAAARECLDHLGYAVRFEAGEAWTGGAWTVPAFRNRGLLTHSCRRRFEYLLRSGWMVSRAAVETGNTVSHRATMRFEPRVYAIGRQWRLLGRRWWSEMPVSDAEGQREATRGH